MLKLSFATRSKFACGHEARQPGFLLFPKPIDRTRIDLFLPVFLMIFAIVPAVGANPAQTKAVADPATAGLLSQGFDLLDRKDASGAEAAFRKAIDARPEIAEAHRGLALALWSEKKGSAAIREMTTATRLASDDADAHFDLGNIAWTVSFQPELARDEPSKNSQQDLLALAFREMKKAVALRPQDLNFHLSLTRLCLDIGQSKEAVTQAREAVQLAPADPSVYIVLGRALLSDKEEGEAEAEFKKALELNPNEGAGHLQLGELRVLQRRFDEAQKEFRRATELSPNAGAAYAAWAELLVNTGHGAQARGLLEKAVALDPQDWQSQYRLATLLSEGGDPTRATSLLEKIAATHPDFLPAREQLAFGLLRRGDLEHAAAQADALVAENPQASEGHHVLALVLWKRRDLDGSLAEIALAEPNEADATAMLALESLELWQLDRKKDARATFLRAAKGEPHLGTSEVFCRLIFCDARDIGPVEDFLKKNRWALVPPQEP